MTGPWDAYQTSPDASPSPWTKYASPKPTTFEPQRDFSAQMDKAFGAGKWRQTSGYREPWHNYAVGGAAESHHMEGTADAPGAHDIVVPGMNAAQIEARMKAAGVRVGSFYPESDHLHVNSPAAQAQTAAPWDRYRQEQKTPAPKSQPHPATAYQAKAERPQLRPGPKGFFDELGREVQHDIGEAARIVSTPKIPTPAQVGTVVTAPLKAASEPGRLAQRAFQRSYSKVPESEEDIRQQEFVGDITSAAVPIPGAAEAKAGKEVVEGGEKVAARLAKLGEHEVIGKEKNPIERIDNAFYRAGGRATSGKIEAKQAVRALPKEVRNAKVQEELTHAIEAKIADPKAKIPEHLQAAEAARQPWAERQRTAVNEIRTMLKERGLTDEEIEEYAPSSETGYVPRRVVGRSPGFDPRDPQAAGRNPLAWKRQATQTTTGSLKQRQFKILTNKEGESFLHEGEAPETDIKGRPYASVRQATIKEIEEGSDVRYHKNATANTIDEALRAERVLDNLKVLDETTKQAAAEGLAHRAEWRFRGADGLTSVARSNKPTPEGFKEIPNVPALKGWTFAPELHQLLSDVLPHDKEPLENVIAMVNRAINASLFITPIPHIKNVATMAFIGRGWDNLNLWRGGKTTAKAITEVLKLGPEYRAWLREGAGMQAGDDATRNFYESMLKAFGNQIEQSVETRRNVAAAFGLNPVDLVKGLYRVSHQALWNVNDMIMFQRYLELKEKGLSAREAIKETEKWVANYRIPPQVLKSRAFQQFISNGLFVNFGRFEYGKLKAIGAMAQRIKEDPIDAAGKIAALGFLGAIAYPVMNEAARKLTGNKNAYITPGGQMNALLSGADLAAREAGMHPHLTAREKDWAGTMASFLTPAPTMQTAGELETGRYGWSGQQIVDPRASPLGKNVQRGEYIAGKYYPAELAIDATKPGGAKNVAAALAGVNLPQSSGKTKAKTEKMLRSQAKRRERRDPTEGLVRSLGFR